MKRKLLSISISILFTIGLIEIFFRILYPQSGYSVTYSEYGWKHLANTSVKFYGEQVKFGWGQKPIKVEYNAKGLRCADWSIFDFRDTDMTCMLLLGDSWLEDMGSPYNNLVHIWLNKKTKGYAINAGHHGFDNAQELMWYLKEGRKYSPDIVIVFYTGDKANPENAVIEDGKLVLKWREFTTKQKVYRNIASWIRLHTHFGSWLLDRLGRLERIKSYLIREDMKEPDNPIVNPETYVIDESDFRVIDKMIYQRLATEIEKDGAKFIMLHCIGDWSSGQKEFFKDNGIYHMFIPSEWQGEGDKERIRDKACNVKEGFGRNYYDPAKESHRFGYGQNKKVAERIIEYLKKEDLL